MKHIINLILRQPLFNALIFLVWLVPDHNVGWAIIILTVIIRLILLPSSLSAARQQKKMKDLQPQLTAIQEKFKGEKEKQAQATMAFYKENKVNPLGSCLPLLVQLPILIVLYYVFRDGLTVNRFDMLYSFTSRPEFIKTVFLGIDLAKPDRWVLPVIAGLLQYVQSRQLAPMTATTTDPNKKGPDMQVMMQKQMMYLMPVFTIFIAGRLPAALPLYWIITSIFTVAQQWYVFKDKSKVSAQGGPAASLKAGRKTKKDNNFLKTIKRGVEVTVRRKGDK